MLSTDEKLYLMIVLMRDLRGSWNDNHEDRAKMVKSLAEDLGYPKTVARAEGYLQNLKDGDNDWRHFMESWEYSGGYEGAPLPYLSTFSRELLICIKDYCNYPAHALPDPEPFNGVKDEL